MAHTGPKDGWHAPATVEEEILEFAKDDTFDFEEQPPRAGLIALISLACLVFILACGGGLHIYWHWYYEHSVTEANQVEPSQLRDVRSREEQELHSPPKYIDKEKGTVQIPIDRAMQLIVEEAAAGRYGQNFAKQSADATAASPATSGVPTVAATGAPTTPAASPAAKPSPPPAKK
ncbi:MAG TPA: hypothetical protein VFD58_18685 [Blastocatellia bacterium]|nr:hypothetical protein [Blastocatellia bacterium]